MGERVDASSGSLEPDWSTTSKELRSAQAEYRRFLATTPLPPGENPPLVDSEAMGRAQERLLVATRGMENLWAWRQRNWT
jgi:hypothetical protein